MEKPVTHLINGLYGLPALQHPGLGPRPTEEGPLTTFAVLPKIQGYRSNQLSYAAPLSKGGRIRAGASAPRKQTKMPTFLKAERAAIAWERNGSLDGSGGSANGVQLSKPRSTTDRRNLSDSRREKFSLMLGRRYSVERPTRKVRRDADRLSQARSGRDQDAAGPILLNSVVSEDSTEKARQFVE